MSPLSPAESMVLRGLLAGGALKSHRQLDGQKLYRLHPLEGAPEDIAWATVERLKRRGLIDSNKKFPAATYLLTEKGRVLAESMSGGVVNPLTARNY